jgi:dienelactone hydrolase
MIRWLASPEGGSRKVGLVGFCWGGGMVNRLAVEAGDALDAAASSTARRPTRRWRHRRLPMKRSRNRNMLMKSR